MFASNSEIPSNENTSKGLEEVNGIRSSLRLRVKSGSNNRDPDFVYEGEAHNTNRNANINSVNRIKVNLFDYQFKSASCSNLPATVEVHRRSKRIESTKKATTVNADSCANKGLVSVSALWHEKQARLSQQRLELMLEKNTNCVDEQNNSLFRMETQGDLSNLGGDLSACYSQPSVTDSFISTRQYLNLNQECLSVNYNEETSEADEADLNNEMEQNKDKQLVLGLDWKAFFLKMQQEINENMQRTVDSLRNHLVASIN